MLTAFRRAGDDHTSCPAPRDAHDGWGCEATGCPMPIHSLALTPVGGAL
jgi:hypothetical protein